MTTSNDHGLTAMTDGNVAAGSITWWRLSGGLDLDVLRLAWLDAGLPENRLPSPPTPKVAFHRAVSELREKRRMVRPMADGSFVIVRETEAGNALAHSCELRVSLDRVGRLQFSYPVGAYPSTFDADKVRASFEHHLSNVIQGDVSPWLCRVMDWVEAVPLRDTGGVYFIPQFATERWGTVMRAIRESSTHAISNVPAMRTGEAVAAFLDAMQAEAEAEVRSIQEQLDSGDLGARALASRVTATERVEQKLSRYEELLGTKLDGLHGRIQEVRAALTVAMLTKSTDAAAE